jgi:hypothetical protein
VYDQRDGVIHWRTDRHAPIRSLRMASLDFSCAAPPLALDVHARISGDARPHLKPLTPEANAALIEGSTRSTSFTRRTPVEEVAAQSRYGFASTCGR